MWFILGYIVRSRGGVGISVVFVRRERCLERVMIWEKRVKESKEMRRKESSYMFFGIKIIV